MHNVPSEIQDKIKELCVDRARSPGDFNEFTHKLILLGVIRQTYDVLDNSLYFYSKDTLLYRLPISEIEKPSEGTPFIIGDNLDVSRVKKAIEHLDAKKLSVFEFHREIAQAGIVYVSVFFKEKTIYYLSQDGTYYLEKY